MKEDALFIFPLQKICLIVSRRLSFFFFSTSIQQTIDSFKAQTVTGPFGHFLPGTFASNETSRQSKSRFYETVSDIKADNL